MQDYNNIVNDFLAGQSTYSLSAKYNLPLTEILKLLPDISRTELLKKEVCIYPPSGISKEAARGYLAGIIDGEGSVYCKGKKAYVSIASTDSDIVFRILECLDLFQINYSLYKSVLKSGKGCYTVSIRRRNLDKLVGLPYGCGRKLEKLKIAIDSTRPIFYKKSYISEEEWKKLDNENFKQWAARNGVSGETARKWRNERRDSKKSVSE